MKISKRIAGLLAALLAAPLLLTVPGRGAEWDCSKTPADNTAFLEEGLSAVDNSSPGRRSMFVWDLYLFNSGAFPTLSKVLTAYDINRVYQEIPMPYFQRQELPELVGNLSRLGIQTAALAGDRRWPEKGLDEYKAWVGALYKYNQANPSRAIPAVALDVESYTLSAFQKAPADGFAAYARCMEEAYQYARQHGLRVIQIIPTTLDTIDRQQFQWFVEHCCDELSIMNYRKDTALAAIWNEVLTCRQLGVPVETIFETMPLNSYYGVTEELTYYYEGPEALSAAAEEMQKVYGSSLGVAYHHFETMYHLETGLYLAELYPYAKGAAHADQNGQIQVGNRLSLRSRDGAIVSAWLYHPNLTSDAAEYCYLAVGVRTGTDYTILLDSRNYRLSSPQKLRFKEKSGKLLYTGSFRVIPKYLGPI